VIKKYDSRPRRRLPLVAQAAAIAALLSVSLVAADEQRVVAVGDVHGSIDGLVGILRATGLVDADNHWVGGTATFVQTGDLLDRGEAVRAVLDLLIGLQAEAEAAGGRVVSLLGNHETMNMSGILRDVNNDAYSFFAEPDSERRRKQGWKAFKKFWRNRARRLGLETSLSAEAEQQWMATYPPGKLEYAQAMSADGRYGRWLRESQVAIVVDDVLFVHGGFGPHLGGMTVDEVNRKTREQIAAFDELRAFMVNEGLILPWHSLPEMAGEARLEIQASQAAVPQSPGADANRSRRARRLEPLLGWDELMFTHPQGPVWFRGAAVWDEQERMEEMAGLLDALGVRHMVVGHTVQGAGRISSRFHDRVFLIDTGMLAGVYAGRPSAIVFQDESISAVYADETHELLAPTLPTTESQSQAVTTRE
jgi:hypothetical protein